MNRLGLGSTSDVAIWIYACEAKAILMSKDADFPALARSDAFAVPVVWVRIGNMRSAALCEAILRALSDVVSAVARGETVVEIRPTP